MNQKLKTFLVLLFLTLSGILNAQNLVPNPSFETISACPSANGQIGLAPPWIDPSGGNGTPDLMNSCFTAGFPSFDVSLNTPGWQNARTGNGYAHIVTDYSNMGAPYTDLKEYIQVQLTSPLVAGQIYDVSFYVSNADHFKYSSNNIGVYFSILPPTSTNYNTLPYIPQINETSVVSDTTNWVLINGAYTATGGEQYITIGNFYHYTLTTINVSNPTTFWNLASYFIDDVCVTPQGGTGCNTILPIVLNHFDVECNNGFSEIKWSTSTEVNNDYFTILRSKDAFNFDAIGTTQGAGNSSHVLNYLFYDKSPYQGISYYQLRQTDYDGVSSLSNVVSINNITESNKLSVYPNPTNKILFIAFNTAGSGNLKIINSLGVVEKSIKYSLDVKSERLSVDVSGLVKGVYYLQISHNNNAIKKKVFIKN